MLKPPDGRPGVDRPRIVCLCGSTRFAGEFSRANLRETLAGHIVLSIGCNTRDSDTFERLAGVDMQAVKDRLDKLHICKIELADEVLIIDIPRNDLPLTQSQFNIWAQAYGVPGFPYVGSSTANERDHARDLGRRIRYLSQETAVAHGQATWDADGVDHAAGYSAVKP